MTTLIRRKPLLIVTVSIAVFVLFFGVSNWFRHVNLYTSQFDMGNMDQVMWHSLRGRWFQMNSPVDPVQHLRTAIHADYGLLVYLPFYFLWPDPRTPLILQVLAVASGAIPLFWLARKRLGEMAGAALVVMYLAYPTLEWAVTFDVHAVVLATPLFLWAWWAAVEKRWWLYAIFIFVAALTKEEVGLVVAAMGLYWIWRRGYRTMGIASMVLGIGWTALMLGWAIPQARQVPGHFAIGYYSEYGGSYGSIISGIFSHPWRTVTDFLDPDALSLWRALLAPVGFMALLGLPVLLIALPEMAVNALSNNQNLQTIFFQYMSGITPFVFLASIGGWERGRRWLVWLSIRWPAYRIQRMVTAGAVGLTILSIWYWSPLPFTQHHRDATKVFAPSQYRRDVAIVQKSLRPTDRVVATNNLVPQFSRRDRIWGFPEDLDQADAIVVLEGGDYELRPAAEIGVAIEQLQNDQAWRLLHHRDQFWYFRRR